MVVKALSATSYRRDFLIEADPCVLSAMGESLRTLFARFERDSSTESLSILYVRCLAGTELLDLAIGGRTNSKIALDALWLSDAHIRKEFFILVGRRGGASTGPMRRLSRS